MKEAPLHTPHELLARHLAGETDVAETQEVQMWRAADTVHEQYYQSLQQAWEMAGTIQQDRLEEIDAAWEDLQQRLAPTSSLAPKPSLFTRYSSIAAAVTLLLTIGLGWLLLRPTPETQPVASWKIYTATDSLLPLTLADGSRVTLRPGSELQVQTPFSTVERALRLRGTALFDVVADARCPFRVSAQGWTVEVLGTQFQMEAEAEQHAVYVFEGKIQLTPAEASPLQVAAGEQVRQSLNSNELEKSALAPNVRAWETQELIFKGENLAQVIATLQDAYAVRIELGSPSLAQCQVQVSFQEKPLTYILTVICEFLGLEWTLNEKGEYLITGQGCETVPTETAN